jgi:hypothetical protein
VEVDPAAASPVLRERYGRPARATRPQLRRVLVAAGLVAAVTAVALAWVVSRPAVDAGVTRISFVSDHRVDVTFEVHKSPGATATCVVRARDATGAQVGYATATVGPAARRAVTVTHRLSTRARAVTGEVVGCRVTAGGG